MPQRCSARRVRRREQQEFLREAKRETTCKAPAWDSSLISSPVVPSAKPFNSFERAARFAGALIAVAGLLQAALDHGSKKTSRKPCRKRRERLVKNSRSQLVTRLAAQGTMAGSHFEGCDAQRPDVAARACFLASRNFWRNVRRRSNDGAGVGGRLLRASCIRKFAAAIRPGKLAVLMSRIREFVVSSVREA